MKKNLKFALLIMMFFIASNGWSAGIKVMTFNTMCKLCGKKKEYGPFKERLKNIADTIVRHNPDLIGTQEIQSASHVKKLQVYLGGGYTPLFKKRTIYPATDTVILVKNSRFEILDEDGVWLGPKAPRFSFGWKLRIPRRFHWVHVRDKTTSREFLFVSSHFDSNKENSVPSALYANKFFTEATIPVIFVADSNLAPSEEGYYLLKGDNMIDTFTTVPNVTIYNNGGVNNDQDNCRTSATWPLCRIDHVMLSKDSPWRAVSWGVDVFRYTENRSFVSDHRAIIVDLIE